ncbi:hypothetical protein PMAYCL1PPCAC_15190, partial [Pristionchus mayeri]
LLPVAEMLETAGSVAREALFAYSTVLSFLVASDRLIATYTYAWYEKQGASTFLVFLVLGALVETYSITVAVFVVYEMYSIRVHLVFMATGAVVGLVCFCFVFRLNLRLHNRFRPHYFGFSDYSIARSYQISENVLILKVLRKVALETAYYTIPTFVLFLFFVLSTAGSGLDFWRNLAIAGFDLFIALYVL